MLHTIYFGTYTRRKSQGIYQAQFNDQTGLLSDLKLWAQEPSPTYLCFDQKNHLYSVGAKEDQGCVAAWTEEGQLLNHVVEDGAPLCYVSYDPKRQLVYGANYHKGQVLVYKQNEDGTLELADLDQHEGSGPHANQDKSHVHYADLAPDGYLITCDLGTDQVTSYQVSEEGKLSQVDLYQSQAGAGPRHLVFHPSYKIAYLICELNGTIEVLIYDGMGHFEHMQTIATIPADYQDFNAGAAIRLSKDGKFLYASNRGHDSIASYRVLRDGSLELIDIVSSNGKTPRDFNLSANDAYLIVAHQDSDNVSVFERDAQSGQIKLVSSDFQVPEAVAVLL